MIGLKRVIKRALEHRLNRFPPQTRAKLLQQTFTGSDFRFHLSTAICCPKRVGAQADLFVRYGNDFHVFTKETLFPELLRYEVVSFDIFDTLLFRRIPKPTDLFGILERETAIPNFARNRIEGEQRAREHKFTSCGTWEVTLKEIYDQFPALEGISNDEMMERELAAEDEYCYANPVMTEVLSALNAAGRRTIAISDMYLSKKQIIHLLAAQPFQGELYVSSEMGCGKGDGKLFRRVLSSEAYRDKSVIHIGDNFHSDVRMAVKSGLYGLHYIR